MNTDKKDGDHIKDSGIQSIARASAVLEVVAAHAVEGTRLGEVVRSTGLNKATAHRILKSLVQTGLLEKDKQVPVYFPGIKLVAIAASASNRFGLAKQSADARARIAEITGDTVFLQLRVGREVVCVARTEGSFPIKTLTLDVGERRPIGIGAGGLAILAFLNDPEPSVLIDSEGGAFAMYGVTCEQVAADVKQARSAGYAVDEDGIIPGITGVAVPIMSGSGDVVAALTVAAISDRMSGNHRNIVVTRLQEEVARLKSDLAPVLAGQTAGTLRLVMDGH